MTDLLTTVGDEVGAILNTLADQRSFSPDAKSRLNDVIALYQSSVRERIQEYLFPILLSLKKRVAASGDITYFSGDTFIPAVSERVKEMVYERYQPAFDSVDPEQDTQQHLEEVHGYVVPILEGINSLAVLQKNGKSNEFNRLIARLQLVVADIEKLR